MEVIQQKNYIQGEYGSSKKRRIMVSRPTVRKRKHEEIPYTSVKIPQYLTRYVIKIQRYYRGWQQRKRIRLI